MLRINIIAKSFEYSLTYWQIFIKVLDARIYLKGIRSAFEIQTTRCLYYRKACLDPMLKLS